MNLPEVYSLQAKLIRLQQVNGAGMGRVRSAIISSALEDIEYYLESMGVGVDDTVRTRSVKGGNRPANGRVRSKARTSENTANSEN